MLRFRCTAKFCQFEWDDERNPYCPKCGCPWIEKRGY